MIRTMSSLPTANHALGDDGAWTLWRDIALRGTGFPIALLDDLADTALAQAVTAHLSADDGLAETMQQARRACHARLQDTADPTARRAWRRVMQTLQAGRAAEPTGDADFDALLAGLATAIAAAADGCQRFGQAFDAADAQTLAHLHRMADDARLREALAWQNPQALLTALAPLQRHVHEGRRNAEDRQHERLLTRYLQRYAAKNDTIGFFGPAGWAQVQGPGHVLELQPGPALAIEPRVSVEPWVVQALAEALTRDAAVRPHLRPWRHPAWRLGPDGAVVVLERSFRLPTFEHDLFMRCNGRMTVAEIAEALRQPADEVDAALARLETAQLIFLKPRIPLDGPALQRLRAVVAALPDHAARARWRLGVDQLLDGTETARHAFGQADAVATVQHGLAAPFQALSGQGPTRLHGNTYAGRGLLVMDARRDLQLRIGEPLALQLMTALRPVLDAAHWYSCQVHAQLSEFASGLFDHSQQGGQMPFDRWWFELQQEAATVQAIVDDVGEQLSERWAQVLPVDNAAKDNDAGVRAAAVFADVAPGWPGANFQAPDVLLAAADAAQLDDAFFVLGELHAADRSLLRQVFVSAHADPQRLVDAVRADQPELELRPQLRTEALLARTQVLPGAPYAFDIECDSVVSPHEPARVLRSGALWLQRRDSELRIVDREQGHDFPLRAFLGPQAGALSAGEFKLYAPAAHRARQRAGLLVVARESWRLTLDTVAPLIQAQRGGPAQAFARVLRLARDQGWPRRVFYRVAGEPKPIYLDLDSPSLVDLFLRTVGAAARRGDPALDVSEMLPDPSQCWLPDAAGARYSSEWRMLFVRRTRAVRAFA